MFISRKFAATTMGSEQSQQQSSAAAAAASASRPTSSMHNLGGHSRHHAVTAGGVSRLQRGNTISVSGQSHPDDVAMSPSRPVSPPISVCSDSDLPYISYTDKPIGGIHLWCFLFGKLFFFLI